MFIKRWVLLLLLDLSTYLKIRYSNLWLENTLIHWASRLRQKRLSQCKQKVAVLGASFNPTTLGHADLIRVLLHHGIQKIDLIPTAQSPLKTLNEYGSLTDRLQILNLVLQTLFTVDERAKINIVTLEISRRSPSWMVLTLSALIIQYRAQESYILVCGYDHIVLMQQWYRWQDLANLCELHFYPREDIDILNIATVQACNALCQVGIKLTIVFNEETQKQQFMHLYQAQYSDQEREFLHLVCDVKAKIRPCSATAIRAYYQKENVDFKVIPEGITPEVHQYILEHHCY